MSFKEKIIDNCISKENQNLLINEIINNNFFPWYLNTDLTFKKGKQKRPSMSHIFINNKKQNSTKAELIYSIFSKILNKNIINCKTILQLPINTKTISYDTPHIDMHEPHIVFLYYVINSDGETILFKNKKIHKKIKPKQGRLLIFDGNMVHTAYQPKKNIRCIINFNVEK
jgi:hypothetical protein